MINVQLDLPIDARLSVYGGGGIGGAQIRRSGMTRSRPAVQLLGGVRYALTKRIDVGLKLRHFRAGRPPGADSVTVLGNAKFMNSLLLNPFGHALSIPYQTDAVVTPVFDRGFRTNSAMISLTFNL